MAIKLSTLKLHKSNPRTISDSALNKLCESIKRDPEFMELRPIIVDADNVIVAGNQRYKACKKNGMAEVPDSWVVKAENLSEEKLKRLMIIDNSPEGLSGEWNLDNLKLNWSTDELESLGFVLELDSIEPVSGLTDPDECPEVKPDAIVKPGELWLLGKHRLLCGDSTNPEDVERLMNGNKAEMLLTDPPYGVGFVGVRSSMFSSGKKGKTYTPIINDNKDCSELYRNMIQTYITTCKDNAALYVFYPVNIPSLISVIEEKIIIRNHMIWCKGGNCGTVALNAQYKPAYETFLYCHKKNNSPLWFGDTKQYTVFHAQREHKGYHPTCKPIKLLESLINNSSSIADKILDLFLGSGSTLIACEQLGRTCYGMEISPNYCDVIIKRWQDFAGKKAIKENGEEYPL